MVGMTCEFQYGRRNRSKGNVLSFGKSQRCVTFSCSRLTDIGSMVYSTGQGLFVMDLGVKNIFDTKIHVWVDASVWLVDRLVASL
jgi:hypothetical protein